MPRYFRANVAKFRNSPRARLGARSIVRVSKSKKVSTLALHWVVDQKISTGTILGAEELIAAALSGKKRIHKDITLFKKKAKSVMNSLGFVIADEMIKSLQGRNIGKLSVRKKNPKDAKFKIEVSKEGYKLTNKPITVDAKSTRRIFERVDSGDQYPHGILRQKTPQGKPYRRIKPLTEAFRNIKFSKLGITPFPGSTKLRLLESGKHILGGMRYHINNKSGSLQISIVYPDKDSYYIAMLHNFGGSVTHWSDDPVLGPEIRKALAHISGAEEGKRSLSFIGKEEKLVPTVKSAFGEPGKVPTQQALNARKIAAKAYDAEKSLERKKEDVVNELRKPEETQKRIETIEKNIELLHKASNEIFSSGILTPYMARKLSHIIGHVASDNSARKFAIKAGAPLFGGVKHTRSGLTISDFRDIVSVLDLMGFALGNKAAGFKKAASEETIKYIKKRANKKIGVREIYTVLGRFVQQARIQMKAGRRRETIRAGTSRQMQPIVGRDVKGVYEDYHSEWPSTRQRESERRRFPGTKTRIHTRRVEDALVAYLSRVGNAVGRDKPIPRWRGKGDRYPIPDKNIKDIATSMTRYAQGLIMLRQELLKKTEGKTLGKVGEAHIKATKMSKELEEEANFIRSNIGTRHDQEFIERSRKYAKK